MAPVGARIRLARLGFPNSCAAIQPWWENNRPQGRIVFNRAEALHRPAIEVGSDVQLDAAISRLSIFVDVNRVRLLDLFQRHLGCR